MTTFDQIKSEAVRQRNRTDIDTLSPSQLGEIIWRHKSGYSVESISARLNVKTWNVDQYIKSVEFIAT